MCTFNKLTSKVTRISALFDFRQLQSAVTNMRTIIRFCFCFYYCTLCPVSHNRKSCAALHTTAPLSSELNTYNVSLLTYPPYLELAIVLERLQ